MSESLQYDTILYSLIRDLPATAIIEYFSSLYEAHQNNGLSVENKKRAGEALQVLKELPKRFPGPFRENLTPRELACSARYPFTLFMANVTKFYRTPIPVDLVALTSR